MNILEEFWYGNIEPAKYDTSSGKEYKELLQLIFCALGAIATLIAAYGLTLATPAICKVESKVFKACMYYITMAMLLLDPLYLSALCGFFGGGDMNGIALLYPEWAARAFFGVLLVLNGILFWKVVLPKYRSAFAK